HLEDSQLIPASFLPNRLVLTGLCFVTRKEQISCLLESPIISSNSLNKRKDRRQWNTPSYWGSSSWRAWSPSPLWARPPMPRLATSACKWRRRDRSEGPIDSLNAPGLSQHSTGRRFS